MRVYKKLQDKAVTEALASGKVGVIPTDTQYGIVAAAHNHEAVSRLYKAKARHSKPGTIVAANLQQLVELGLKKRYLRAVEQYWPGPISIVIPTGRELDYLHGGKNSLAVRLPDYPSLTKLLSNTGPLLTSSANMPGQTPCATIQAAISCFGSKVDFYVDGGDLSERKPSTLIRIVDDAIEVLRPGAVNINEETGDINDA